MSKHAKKTPAKIVTRDDIQQKLVDINKTIEEETSSSKDKLQLLLVIAVSVGLGLAYLSGRRKSLRKKTLVTFTKTR